MEFSCLRSGDKCHVELVLLGQGCTGKVCWEVFWEIYTLEIKSIHGPLHLLKPDLQRGKEGEATPCDQNNFTAASALFQILSHFLNS